MRYLDPATPRKIEGWHSPSLSLKMPIVGYGDRGRPLLLFPTAAADFLENERFFLIQAIEPLIASGRVRVFSIESINRLAWMDRHLPVHEQARRQALYSRYVEEEVVPYIRAVCRDASMRVATTGASFGAFHAANVFFRRPDLFDTLIAMSGFYDLGPGYLEGYSDDNCYFNNPASFIPGLHGHHLHLLQHECRAVVVTGQGAWEKPEASYKLAELCAAKGIPCHLDVWGHDVNHDWPWWRRMLPYWLDRLY